VSAVRLVPQHAIVGGNAYWLIDGALMTAPLDTQSRVLWDDDAEVSDFSEFPDAPQVMLALTPGIDLYEARVRVFELQGMTRSDAQGVADAEDTKS